MPTLRRSTPGLERVRRRATRKTYPPTPTFAEAWHIKPDIIFTIPEFTVSGASQDEYEYIYVPTNFTEDKWVQAAEVLPGDRRGVHHTTVSVIAADKVAKDEEEHSGSNAGVEEGPHQPRPCQPR